MRRINKYRGIHIHVLPQNERLNGAWVYGYLADEDCINSAELGGDFLVDKDTVGQCIGVKDKNKQEIYEKDIIQINGYHELFVVNWIIDTASFGLQSRNYLLYFEFGIGSRIEVIGNMHENPDLLKEAENE